MRVKGTKQLGSFKKGINLYIPNYIKFIKGDNSTTYIFLSGDKNTIGTLLDSNETSFGISGIGTEIRIFNFATNSFLTYLRRTSTTWRDGNNLTVNDLVIDNNSIFGINNPTNNSKIFTKQGLNKIILSKL